MLQTYLPLFISLSCSSGSVSDSSLSQSHFPLFISLSSATGSVSLSLPLSMLLGKESSWYHSGDQLLYTLQCITHRCCRVLLFRISSFPHFHISHFHISHSRFLVPPFIPILGTSPQETGATWLPICCTWPPRCLALCLIAQIMHCDTLVVT